MDISALKPTNRVIEIKNPGTGEPLGVRVTIVSMDDDRLKTAKRAIMDRRLYLEQRGKSFKAEEVEENTHNLLWAATIGWEWYNPTGSEGDIGYNPDAMPTFEAEQPEFNQRNFKRVITTLPWFADQINEEIGERKAFFDNSKSN
jgi:hypothetical protein